MRFMKINEPVSIIIPVYNCLKYLRECIESVFKYTDNYELIIIDNASYGPTRDYIKSLNNVRVITNKENRGFAYACNQGVKIAKYKYYCLLNSDTVVTPNWLSKLMMGFNQPNAGIVTPTTTYCPATQSLFKKPKDNISIDEIIKLSFTLKEGYQEIIDLQGFCYLIKKEVIDKIGVFDWKNFPIGGAEEVDFNLRARKAGFRLYWVKQSFVHHYRHKTFEEMKIDKHIITKSNLEVLRKKKSPNLFIENEVEI